VQNIRHVSKFVVKHVKAMFVFINLKAILRNVVKIIVSVALLGNNAFQFSILFFSAATKVTSETITYTNLHYFSTKKMKINRFLDSTSTIFVHFKSWTDNNYICKSILLQYYAMVKSVKQVFFLI